MLPKIDLPVYDTKLSYSKKKVKYRPFTVKEEKLLLIAGQGKDPKEITNAIIQVVNNCVIEIEGKLSVSDLPAFEIDFLFLQMRGKSIGGNIKQELTCNNIVDDKKCGMVMEIDLKVEDAFITDGPKTDVVKLNDKLNLKLKYPKFNAYDERSETYEYDILIDCLDYVYDNENVYKFKEQTKEECIAFIEGLTKEKFTEIQIFYDAIPEVQLNKSFQCTKCGFNHQMRLENPLDFF